MGIRHTGCVLLFLLLSIFILDSNTLWAKELFSFQGQFNWKEKKVDIKFFNQEREFLDLSIQEESPDSYHLKAILDHLTTPFLEISSEIESHVKRIRKKTPEQDLWQGEIASQYTLLDYKPVKELKGLFTFEEERLVFSSLCFGQLCAQGQLQIEPPYKIKMTTHLDPVSLDDFISFWAGNKEYEIMGEVYGDIDLSGTVPAPYLKGKFETHDGFIKNLAFNNLFLNIEGYYPHMEISDSVLTETAGLSFSFSGPFNLADKDNFKKQIKNLTKAPLISRSDSTAEWTIRRRGDESATTEFKYFLKKRTDIGADEDFGILGIERKINF